MSNLAYALQEWRALGEAAALYRRSLEIQHPLVEREHLKALLSMNEMAVTLPGLKRFAGKRKALFCTA